MKKNQPKILSFTGCRWVRTERWEPLPISELPQPSVAAAGTNGAGGQHTEPVGCVGAALPQPPTPLSCSPAPALLSRCFEGELWQTHQRCRFAARKHSLVPPPVNAFLRETGTAVVL